MSAIEFSFVNHMCTWRAHITGGPRPAVGKTCQELHFYGDGPVLLFGHLPRVLAMEHDATVKDGIRWRIFLPFIRKAILQAQVIMGEWLFIIKVAKLVIEGPVLIIAHFDHAVFHPEGIAEVDAGFMMMDFNDPVVDVFSVKERYPFPIAARSSFLFSTSGDENKNYNGK